MRFLFLLSGLLLLSCNITGEKSSGNLETENTNSGSDTSVVYYSNGQVKMAGRTLNGKKEGQWKAWYPNGNPWSETTFSNGLRNGPTTTWYENGIPRYKGAYLNDTAHGTWYYYDSTGVQIEVQEL